MIFGQSSYQLKLTELENATKMRQWQRHYAWFPVLLNSGKFAWLQYVHRRVWLRWPVVTWQFEEIPLDK